MPSRDLSPELQQLERELRDLGTALLLPPTPDVRASVRTALAGQPARSTAFGRTWPVSGLRQRLVASAAALAVAVAGALLLSPAARAAAADLLRFAGIELRDQTPPGPPGEGRLPSQTPESLAGVRARVSFPVLAPSRLGRPDSVTVSDGGRVVTLTYRAGPGRPPAGPDGVAVRIDQSAQGLDLFFRKYVDPRLADEVQVGSDSGLYVRKAHQVAYVDRNGVALPATVRLAPRTLVWRTSEVTVRMESALDRDAAVALARTATAG